MPEPGLSPLPEWETFYLIIGSAAAALTGLQFVVIALAAETRTIQGEKEAAAFATPTIVHFSGVLLISAFLSMPGQTPATLGICLTVTGVIGLAYCSFVLALQRRQTGYEPVLEDWVWHTVLPFVAYTLLLFSGISAYTHPKPALYFIATTALLLLFIGIHNAWDAAVYMTTSRRREIPTPPPPDEGGNTASMLEP